MSKKIRNVKKQSALKDRVFTRELVRLALPIVFQHLMLASVAAADAFMLGSIEQNAMAAVSLATQIQFVQNMFLFSVVSAVTLLAAQYWGKKDYKTVGDIFCIGLRFNGAISILFFLGCMFLPEPLMRIFTNEPVLIEYGVSYLKIAGWSYLLTGISQCYLCILKVSEHTSQTALISGATVVLNIVLNALFIYGLLGLPRLEEKGAAAATLISRCVELGWCIVLSYKKGYIHPTLHALLHRVAVLSKDFFKALLPLLGASLMWGIGFTSYSAFMGHLGTDAAAANSIASVVRDLVCCLCDGLSGGGGIIVGFALGRGDLETGRRYGDYLKGFSFIIGGFSTVLMLLLTPLLLNMVDLTDGATYYLFWMMVVMAFYMIGRAGNTVIINGIFVAGGDTAFDAYSLAVTMWGIAVPLAFLGTFVLHWSPIVVYAMTCLDEVGKIPWVLVHYNKYKWLKDLTREKDELIETEIV